MKVRCGKAFRRIVASQVTFCSVALKDLELIIVTLPSNTYSTCIWKLWRSSIQEAFTTGERCPHDQCMASRRCAAYIGAVCVLLNGEQEAAFKAVKDVQHHIRTFQYCMLYSVPLIIGFAPYRNVFRNCRGYLRRNRPCRRSKMPWRMLWRT